MQQIDLWNQQYAQNKEPIIYDDWLDKYAAVLLESLEQPILDLGCGNGNNTKYLLEKGFQVIACDYSSEAIKIINDNFAGVETRIFDMSLGLPFANDSFKIIIADLSLHYFDLATSNLIIAEISRVLSRNGVLLSRVNSINDQNYGAGRGVLVERNCYQSEMGWKRFFDRQMIDDLFKDKFTIVNAVETEMSRYQKVKVLWEVCLRKRDR